jgi:MYXO-CTERM domain-containing protein
VCCDEACQGTCRGCKASIKGFGSDGICEDVKNNTDPANDCEPAVGDKCGLDGQCNGSGSCRLAPTGTACGATTCQGNSVLGQSCNGQGDCVINQGGVDCAPYVCRDVDGAFQCTQPCADDNDCRDGYYCSDDAKCTKKLANGKTCESSGICDSGFCVDGLCCDASCKGQCEACNAPGNEGVCTPVQGDPVGARPACDHAGEECGGSCDGVNAAACRYAVSGDPCGTPSCTNAVAEASSCDGQGSCRASKPQECTPYNCGDDETCLTKCLIDDDCSEGYACNAATGKCTPAAGAECSEDRQSSVGSNGITTPCKPFLCVPASGTCAVSCAFTTDCAPDFVCEKTSKTCLPAPPDGAGDADEEGCACRAAGSAPRGSRLNYLALVALGLAVTGLRRRRRSHKSPARASNPQSPSAGL